MPLNIHIRETGQNFRAKVAKLNSRVDGVSQQLEVEAQIEKGGGRLLPGMVGMAQFQPAAAPGANERKIKNK
jgi:multidrug efflux pump subunit AcrA (membrane-fusion protein)